MKHNKLVKKLLQELGNKKVYFQAGEKELLPLTGGFYEVDNTLVVFTGDEEYVTNVDELFGLISNNYYTDVDEEEYDEEADGVDPNFSVALSTLDDWECDKKGFNSLREITGVIELEDRVILTTVEYDSKTLEVSRKIWIVADNSEVSNTFVNKVKEIANSDEYSKCITVFV